MLLSQDLTGSKKSKNCAYVIYEWSHSHQLLLDAASVPTYNDKICHLDVLGTNHLLQIWNLGFKIRRWRRNYPMCTPTNPKREQPLTYHKKQKKKVQPNNQSCPTNIFLNVHILNKFLYYLYVIFGQASFYLLEPAVNTELCRLCYKLNVIFCIFFENVNFIKATL